MTRKLTAKELERFQATLLQARNVLSGDVRQLEQEALGLEPDRPDSEARNDGTERYFQEFNLELLERDEKTLGEVVEALERIASGLFGQCEKCQSWIPRERLRAVPHARFCIGCQRAAEVEGL